MVSYIKSMLNIKPYIYGTLVLLASAASIEWLLNQDPASSGDVSGFSAWKLASLPSVESTENIIDRLQSIGNWPGINEVTLSSDETALDSGQAEDSASDYTLVAIIKVEKEDKGAEDVAILVDNLGLISRVQEGDQLGAAHRVAAIRGTELSLEPIRSVAEGEGSGSGDILTLKLYPDPDASIDAG